ncbi:hypothetical protein SAMN05661080_00536 [Modestobacter sp. DSM 44400]|uniref:hypothetical protein n=1 Tax=Modestobacter sp. DSM 44400 TaxID=1550230 RepID=UPI00089B3BC1|nr:hypothetical protein [Modestobacter sp. DSM 44400]SDX60282.1 hypothetical protein SAMN05661080_00536 [Modestobacter sp. DSM 44400]
MTTRAATLGTTSPDTLQRALRMSAVLTVVSLAFQFVTAGQLFPQGGPEELHAGGAIVLHVLSGLTAIAAVLLWRRSAAPPWAAVLAVVVFVLTFVQAATGGRDTLWVHVPGAMVLTVGAAWVMVWSLGRGTRT